LLKINLEEELMKAVRKTQMWDMSLGRRPAEKLALALCTLVLLVPPCVAQGTNSQAPVSKESVLSQADRQKVIYVSDFELDPANFKQDKGGITGKGYLLPPPPGSVLRRKRHDPETEARNLINLMSESLVADLQKAGFTARRLLPVDPKPADGLVVSGVFTEIDEGNQMRRALVGFGSGKAKMELYVKAAEVSSDAKPLYEVSTNKSNGKRPGAVIALNPYVGTAGFVVKFGMTKNAPEKIVKQTASKIAAELTKQLNTDSLGAKN
jgi:Domain of unknown function (DUF4410)